jgi:hypothetical protein
MSGRTRPPINRPSERPTLQGAPRGFSNTGLATGQRRNRLLAGALTIAAHIIIFIALFWPHSKSLPSYAAPPPPPILVNLLDLPKPAPPAPQEPARDQAGGPDIAVPPLPPATSAPKETVANAATPDNSDLLSESQLAGTTTVGEGAGPASACDMGHAVQQALRRDPMVHAAVEGAHRIGKAIILWNGDWVRSGDQDGKGLSAVREAIMWEVAFAPEACRNMRVHGLVLLSLADGGTRIALGSDDWRWSDLLGLRKAPSDR